MTLSNNSSSNSSPSNPKNNKRKPPQILLGITGSVAAVKGPELALEIAKSLHAKVIVVLTKGGTNFWYKAKDYNELKWNEYCSFMNYSCSGSSGNGIGSSLGLGNNVDESEDEVMNKMNERSVFSMLEMKDIDIDNNCHDSFQGEISICHAEDEWNEWNKIGDPVLHIQLRDWADMMIIAPLSANTLGKLSNGLCDDTLSCILRAWDYGYRLPLSSLSSSSNDSSCTTKKKEQQPSSFKPIIVAPAMNTSMWEHPITKQQLETIKGFWNNNNDNGNNCSNSSAMTSVVDPQAKTLACGDVGIGAMADVSTIVDTIREIISHT